MDELALIQNVVVRSKIERWVGFAQSSKNRRKFLEALYHFADFEPAVVHELPPTVDTASGFLNELRRRGAGEMCRVASVDRDLDGKSMALSDAIEKVFGLVEGTLLICSSRLAYYEGESPRNHFILHRR